MNIYLSYDYEGFSIAKQNGGDEWFDSRNPLDVCIAKTIEWAEQDLKVGIAKSYQIYNESGVLLFDSNSKQEAAS